MRGREHVHIADGALEEGPASAGGNQGTMRPVADVTMPPPRDPGGDDAHPSDPGAAPRRRWRTRWAYALPVVTAALGVAVMVRNHRPIKKPPHVAAAAGGTSGAPTTPHPRLFLDPTTLATMKAQSSDATKGAAQAKTKCNVAYATPGQVEWGFGWAYAASSCALAYQVTGEATYATKGLFFTNALLDDFHAIGDGLGGNDVITHDTGYFMRVYAPYAALAYDWLHDAPGMTETVRLKMRTRFAAWLAWYDAQGYLRHRAGANYQAGYLFASTLIAVAEGGEAGPAGDQAWTNVVTTLFDVDMVGQTKPGGALDGGDWAEGWQYGPLSVMEYALATRALAEQGHRYPTIDKYVSDLVRRYLHGSSPAAHGLWIGGDTSHGEWQNAPPNARILIAAIAGTASADTKTRARSEMAARGLSDKESPVFQALADAALVPATSSTPAAEPTVYVSPSMQTIFSRGSWTDTTSWSLFTSGPRLVEDHQHADAGNWVLSRGADNLVVDASPYSSLSSLTSNAPAVDSNAVPPYQTPSQGWFNLYGKTHLVFSRALPGGGAVARGDYADNFRRESNTSDVKVALRDFVFLPSGDDGTVVTFDRVDTGDAARGAHLRVTTPGTATVSGKVATAKVGASSLRVQLAFASSGSLYAVTPPVSDDCTGVDYGKCDKARFPVTAVKLDVAGPSAAAVFVVDSGAAGSAAPPTQLLSGAGFRGVLLTRGATTTAVIGADSAVAANAATLVYRVPSGVAARHVVLDAPRGTVGRSDVTVKAVGADCEVTVARRESAGGFDGAPLVIDVAPACGASDPGVAPVDGEPRGTTTANGGDTSGTGSSAGTGSGASNGNGATAVEADTSDHAASGCAVAAPRVADDRYMFALLGGTALFVASRRRWGRRRDGLWS